MPFMYDFCDVHAETRHHHVGKLFRAEAEFGTFSTFWGKEDDMKKIIPKKDINNTHRQGNTTLSIYSQSSSVPHC
jgi:hypothetical protein